MGWDGENELEANILKGHEENISPREDNSQSMLEMFFRI